MATAIKTPKTSKTHTLITKRGAAEMLKCSPRTVDRMIAKFGWRTVELHSRAIRIVEQDVVDFIEGQVGKPVNEV